MEDLEKDIENLKMQQEQAKNLFDKCQGAIEYIKEKLKQKEEQDSSTKKEKK